MWGVVNISRDPDEPRCRECHRLDKLEQWLESSRCIREIENYVDSTFKEVVTTTTNYRVHEADRLVHHSVPAYSIALRTVGFKMNESPGPARYKDVAVSGPKIPHLRSAPAYSMLQKTAFGSMLSNIVKTPGPCAYKHVDTDVFKPRAPKYTIMERNLIPGDTTMKPGPGRYRAEDVNIHKHYPKYTFGIHHSEYLAPLIVTPSD
ncbi:outer dense fiber protein 3-like [Carcharodon carcharias]|uniref:outer dense fiber protein 3-like n=1 Tax=Carcharodon carcharias TaxID=13397 RepID=UPI001B7DA758|nr:outer dense fiber protein 3-like [Carcharodon carcharias]